MSAPVDVQFFKPFIESTLKVIDLQCSTKAKAGKPYFKGDATGVSAAIAGVLGLSSPKYQGTITLMFEKPTFLGLMNRMLGEQYTEITADLEDGAGELLNIIFGMSKTVLNAQGYDLAMAIPSIVVGDRLRTRHLSRGRIVVIPFKTDIGEFEIEILIETGEPATK